LPARFIRSLLIMATIRSFYKKLYRAFGPQHWWPAETAFEVMVGAILTQNTAWSNVERAITRLKKEKVLSPDKLAALPQKKLAGFIRSAGYYNIKAKRLKNFLDFYCAHKTKSISRQQLLAVNGIGPETADSILLYALNQPVFVVDAYTKRILTRHSLIKEGASYDEVQNLFMCGLKKDAKLFNEYHALLVKLAKDFCLKNKPKCNVCPLKEDK